MIDYIKGTLTIKEISRLCVEAHGVGYEIHIPISTFESVPSPGVDVKILVHYYVREDAHKLFGFWTERERSMFRLLIGISGVGPKVALSVLSGISVDDLVNSVSHADPSRLEKISGIGTKTAQRMVLELKGKVTQSSSLPARGAAGIKGGMKTTMATLVRDEAFAAMVALGYNDKQVSRALSRVEQTIEESAPVEEWIRKSLQVI